MAKVNVDRTTRKARKFVKEGRFEEAEALCVRVLDHYPRSRAAEEVIALIKAAHERVEMKTDFTEQACAESVEFDLEKDSSEEVIALIKATHESVEMKTDVTEEACAESIEFDLEKDSSNSVRWNSLGMTALSNGNVEDARTAFTKSLSINPDYAEAMNNLGSLHAMEGSYEAAIDCYTRATLMNPDYAEGFCNLGKAFLHLGRLDEALDSFKSALALDPNHVSSIMNANHLAGQLIPAWHVTMLNDQQRNEAYFEAIKAVVDEDSSVLDIGTGSGLLSMMATSSGSSSVVTCEASKKIAEAGTKIIAANGLSGKVRVINKFSKDLSVGEDCDDRFDIVMSEILSSEYVGEGVRPTTIDARERLLKPGGRIIPERGEIRAALLGDSDEVRNTISISTVNQFDVSIFNDFTQTKFTLPHGIRPKLLSEAVSVFDICSYTDQGDDRHLKIGLKACEAGLCLGVIQWIRIHLFEDITYENKPEECSSHWAPQIYVFENPILLREGSILDIDAYLFKDTVWLRESKTFADS